MMSICSPISKMNCDTAISLRPLNAQSKSAYCNMQLGPSRLGCVDKTLHKKAAAQPPFHATVGAIIELRKHQDGCATNVALQSKGQVSGFALPLPHDTSIEVLVNQFKCAALQVTGWPQMGRAWRWVGSSNVVTSCGQWQYGCIGWAVAIWTPPIRCGQMVSNFSPRILQTWDISQIIQRKHGIHCNLCVR